MSKKTVIYASRNPKDGIYSTSVTLSNFMPKRPPYKDDLLCWFYWGPMKMNHWWTRTLDWEETKKLGIDDLECGMCRRLYDGYEIPISKAKRLSMSKNIKEN